MTETLLYILALILVEGAFTINAVRTGTPHRLRGFVIINMLLIALYAPKILELWGYQTNVGNIFFAAVVLMQAIVLTRYGKEEGIVVAKMSVRSMAMFMILGALLGAMPVVGGNEVFSEMAYTISNNGLSVIAASFIAFIMGQYFYIKFYDWFFIKDYRKSLKLACCRYLSGIVALQIVDSFVFFGIAFQGYEGLWEAMIVGFVFKVVLAVIFLPLYLYSINLKIK